jgi:hypothetical protein
MSAQLSITVIMFILITFAKTNGMAVGSTVATSLSQNLVGLANDSSAQRPSDAEKHFLTHADLIK